MARVFQSVGESLSRQDSPSAAVSLKAITEQMNIYILQCSNNLIICRLPLVTGLVQKEYHFSTSNQRHIAKAAAQWDIFFC